MKQSGKVASVFAAMALGVLAFGCRVRDVKTVTVRIPEATHASCTNSECAAAVSRALNAALKSLPDVRLTNDRDNKEMCLKIERIDAATGDVIVRYDSIRVAKVNLEEAFANAGFSTEHFPANTNEWRKSLSSACFAK